MKIRTAPTLIASLTFCFITGFYSTYEAPSDGWTEIGFPFFFYKYTSGKIDPLTIEEVNIGFASVHFLLDLAVLALFIYIFNKIASKYKIIKRA